MHNHDRNISRYLMLLFITLILISCQGAVRSYQTVRAPEPERGQYRQAINNAYLWLDRHPASFEHDGPLAILEEIIAFYVLRNNTEDISQREDYFNEIQKRVDLIASTKDYTVTHKEHTLFLTVTLIAEKIGINTPYFRKSIEDALLSDPLLYSQHITNTIWNILYLERLGYEPQMDIDTAMKQSNLQQESEKRVLFNLVSGQVNPLYLKPMIITAYFLTHEIFSLTDFGELPPPAIIADNKAFFAELLDRSIQWTVAIAHVDLLAELIMCVKMLNLEDVPSLNQGIAFILSKQEENGTFGITNPSLSNLYRHGVLVSMMALSMI